jgi:hypothetical protein
MTGKIVKRKLFCGGRGPEVGRGGGGLDGKSKEAQLSHQQNREFSPGQTKWILYLERIN